jgi:hypothetical protein
MAIRYISVDFCGWPISLAPMQATQQNMEIPSHDVAEARNLGLPPSSANTQRRTLSAAIFDPGPLGTLAIGSVINPFCAFSEQSPHSPDLPYDSP